MNKKEMRRLGILSYKEEEDSCWRTERLLSPRERRWLQRALSDDGQDNINENGD